MIDFEFLQTPCIKENVTFIFLYFNFKSKLKENRIPYALSRNLRILKMFKNYLKQQINK